MGECQKLILLAKSDEYTDGKTEEVSDAQADRKPTDTGKDARSGVGRVPERRAGDDYAGRIGFHF